MLETFEASRRIRPKNEFFRESFSIAIRLGVVRRTGAALSDRFDLKDLNGD
jgi:hypothetical protein